MEIKPTGYFNTADKCDDCQYQVDSIREISFESSTIDLCKKCRRKLLALLLADFVEGED